MITDIPWVGYSEHILHEMDVSKFQGTTPKVTLILGDGARKGCPCLMTESLHHTLQNIPNYLMP